MSLPGQVRARSPGTASRQNQGLCGPLAHHPWPPILARKVEEEYQHQILYFDSFT